MKMDLKHFKVVSSDDKSTTFQHKRGHKIVVAHAGLPKEQVESLKNLPHFDNGGTVGLHDDFSTTAKNNTDVRTRQFEEGFNKQKSTVHQDSDEEYAERRKTFGGSAPRLNLPPGMADGGPVQPMPIDPQKAKEVQDSFKKALGFADGTPDGTVGDYLNAQSQEPAEEPIMSQMSPEQTATIPTEQTAPTSNSEQLSNVQVPAATTTQQQNPLGQIASSQLDSMQQSINQMQGGVNAQAAAEGAQGKQEAQAAQQHQAQIQEIDNHFQKTSQSIDAEREAVYNDLANGHIDPHHFVNSMSGFGKGMTAIGLLLGGIGSGLTHGPNVALDFLNKNIDRDIEGQKAEMGKKENLLTHLNQQFGNIRDATTMAKAMQADMYAAKINEVAAQSKNPMAIAKAQQTGAALRLKYEPEIEQLKLRQAVLSGTEKGIISPEKTIPILVPKEQQAKAFDNMGKLQALIKNKDTLMQLFDQASKENTMVRTVGGLRTPGSVISLQNMMLPQIKDLEGRVNEFEFNSLKNFIPSQGDWRGKEAAKREGFENFLNQKQSEYESNLRGFGVPLPKSVPPSKFKRR